MRSVRLLLLALVLCCVAERGVAQEVEKVSQVRFGFSLDWKLVKGLNFSIAPEMRRGESFTLDQFQVEAALRYKTFGFLYWGASYRLVVLPDDSGATYNKTPEANGRYEFSVMAKEKFGRFTPSVRALYTNYSDEDIDDKKYMRYRLKLDYNIKNFRLDPYVALETFQNLSDGDMSKVRYNAGVDLKVKKGQVLNLDYKLDYYLLKYKNRNIFSLGYKFSF